MLKALAIIRLAEGADPERVRGLMGEHLRATWALHKDVSVRAVEELANIRGALVTLECESADQVDALIGQLPLVKAGLVSVQTILVKPYGGWEQLFREENGHA